MEEEKGEEGGEWKKREGRQKTERRVRDEEKGKWTEKREERKGEEEGGDGDGRERRG